MRVVNEEVMLDYPRSLVKDRSCAPYVIKTIVAQVQSMIELCIFKCFVDLSMCLCLFCIFAMIAMILLGVPAISFSL